ncbi:MAG: hypothetical protein LBJ41_01885 [Treponema sp.]|nr:hypothetical protein [Treponema sp.]
MYLLSGGKRVKKKKTAARKSTCNPVWNEALTFNVASSNLSNAAVEVRSVPCRDQRWKYVQRKQAYRVLLG